MKFLYEYRTSDNVRHEGVIAAAHREEAFDRLRAQGIKPGRLVEAPGFFNKLFGKGKRWLAISVLLVAVVLAVARAHEAQKRVAELDYAERSQIYGDRGVLRRLSADGWAAVFQEPGERLLARYAIPGVPVAENPGGDLKAALAHRIEILPTDLEEVKDIKRIVNGMKRELREYLRDGGTVEGYVKRLDRRQRQEIALLRRVTVELSHEKNEAAWVKKNEELRAVGLPMVDE